ncbi:MAG TPA: hypothetical protein VIU46_09595 [Gallionellaceae bacterium]
MSKRDAESHQVIGAAQRYVKYGDRSDLEAFSLPILQKTIYQLGNLDTRSGYRSAIEDRIKELSAENEKAPLIEVKPSFHGVGLNLNEAWRRIKAWLNRK